MTHQIDDKNDSRPSNDEAAETLGHPVRSTEAFYGRRKGKAFKPHQAKLYAALLPKLAIDLEQAPPENLAELFVHNPTSIVLEIGFGGAEHLIHRAKLHPEIGFIGCEPFINGMAKALASIEREGLSNIRLYNDDATQLLDWLPDSQIDRIDLLYPDPWPKKRHWKRRFVSQKNLSRIHKVIKSAGEFRFASDIDTYVNWTLQHTHAHGGFEWTAKKASDWHEPWEEWYSTRYEQKAIREDRPPTYMIFKTT